jgi:hypothetical protein
LNRSHIDHDNAAFDDAGDVVPSVGFDYAAVDGAFANEDAIRSRAEELDRNRQQEDVIRLIEWLTSGAPSLAEIGRRTLTLRHHLRPETSQKKLAARCGITEAALSMRLSKLRRSLSSQNQN